jgi:hypothetical protein
MPALLRLTGRAAIAAATVHLLQFLVLGIGPALAEPDFPTPAQSAANYWFGLAGAATFLLIALSYLVFFSAASELVWPDQTGTGRVWRRAAQSAAVIGIAGWLLSGVTNLARRGFNATGIAEAAGGDDAISRAALQATSVIVSVGATTMAMCFGAWFVAFAARAVRTGVFGWPTAIAVVLFGAVTPLTGWLANIGGIPAIIVAFLVLGPVLLVKAKRARAESIAPEFVEQ